MGKSFSYNHFCYHLLQDLFGKVLLFQQYSALPLFPTIFHVFVFKSAVFFIYSLSLAIIHLTSLNYAHNPQYYTVLYHQQT